MPRYHRRRVARVVRHVIVGAAEPVVPSEEPGAALSMRWQEQNTTYATRIRNITSTDLMLGCAFNASQGGNPDKECCIATIMDALRWNFSFDTAPLYRDSEEVLGEAFRAAVANGADIDLLARQVWTKVGLRTGGTWNMNPDKCQWVTHGGATKQTARASVEESCRRLGLPSLAGVRFHDIPSGELSTTGELVEAATAPGGMLEGLRELRTEGVIREVSLGMNVNGGKAGDSSAYGQPETVLQLLRSAPPGTFDSALISGGWNLLNQDAFEVLVECEKMGVAVHIAGIYNGGMITGGTPNARMPFDSTATTKEQLARWDSLAAKHEVPLPAVALQLAHMPKCVSKIVIGLCSPEELATSHGCARFSHYVPAEIFHEAQAMGLIRPEVVLPALESPEVVSEQESPK